MSDRNGGSPSHMDPHQYAMAQQVNDFGNHIRHLMKTENQAELTRIGATVDSSRTGSFLFDQVMKKGNASVAGDIQDRQIGNPDTAMISLSNSGPDYHHTDGDVESWWKGTDHVTNYRRKLKMGHRERIVRSEGRRAAMRGFDKPPASPARSPHDLKTESEDPAGYHSPTLTNTLAHLLTLRTR